MRCGIRFIAGRDFNVTDKKHPKAYTHIKEIAGYIRRIRARRFLIVGTSILRDIPGDLLDVRVSFGVLLVRDVKVHVQL